MRWVFISYCQPLDSSLTSPSGEVSVLSLTLARVRKQTLKSSIFEEGYLAIHVFSSQWELRTEMQRLTKTTAQREQKRHSGSPHALTDYHGRNNKNRLHLWSLERPIYGVSCFGELFIFQSVSF